MTRLIKPFIVGLGAAALSSCGLQGDLTRPDPLFGTPSELEPAEPLDRSITDGLDDLQEARRSEDEDDADAPDPEDELLGGPGGI